jgi:5-(carboxyamino)imidazole ribonucleotide synthase
VTGEVWLPGATIGILGGGQLGRMLALEARRMGYRTVVLDPGDNGPAAQVADAHIPAPLDDLDAVRELARRSDVVTLEWENADLQAARAIEETVPLRPGSHVLAVAQHRLREKEAARSTGLATAGFRAVRSLDDLRSALQQIGTPAVLKTCRGGYDGRGQVRIRDAADAAAAYQELSGYETELILEEWIPFEREISVITARSPGGEMVSFPVGENIHHAGILEATLVPARVPEALAREAQRMAEAFAERLDVVGLLAVEMFVAPDQRLLVNEIAPRPHNSGHYTWEACTVSQFEQHLRAVCGLPLGSPELLRPAAMINLLGHEIGTGIGLDTVPEALAMSAIALHLYGKSEARPGRKMGHLTGLASTAEEALENARAAKQALMRGFAAE